MMMTTMIARHETMVDGNSMQSIRLAFLPGEIIRRLISSGKNKGNGGKATTSLLKNIGGIACSFGAKSKNLDKNACTHMNR